VTDTLQVIKDLGLPFGVMVAGIIVLWRENRRLQAKVEELYDRLVRGGKPALPEERIDAVVSMTERLQGDVRRLMQRARKASPPAADAAGAGEEPKG
jgi:hypothetical protein